MTKLMPLYVAGDLAGQPEREAVTHLAACDECRQLAEEFVESNSLLTQAFAQPEFDAEFYAGIRRAVLGKISSETIVSKPWPFEGRWGRRWIYAASLAVVVITMVTLFRGISRQTSQNVTVQALSGRSEGAGSSSPRQVSQSPRESHPATHAQTGQSHVGSAGTGSRRSNRQIEVVRKPEAPDTGTAREVRKEITPAITLSERSTPSSSGTAYSSEVSRIEIQTADPNIRIIWLIPRDSRKSDETINNQDPHENGKGE
jgi:hypothetical protein